MNITSSLHDILPDGMTTKELLSSLRKRILTVNENKNALERGAAVKQAFPELAKHTISLAEEALKGMMVLPGTGPDLYFVGNPPKWTYNPVNDNEYTFHLNRMHHLKTLAEAYSLTGNLMYAKKALDELSDWIEQVPCPDIKDDAGAYIPEHFEGLTPWRALEVGIRGYRTWPIIIELLAETPYFTEELLEKILCSIDTHCQILYHVSPLLWPKADHNHYLMENLGLMSFACLFPEMKNSALFLSHSQKELERCLAAQCTACGGQIEGSPSYHNGCVFWFAMRVVFGRKFHVEVPAAYINQLDKMFQHSVHATRACGGNFPWGDSHIAEKETMSLAAVSCYMACADPKYLETALYFYPTETVLEDIRDNLWRIPNPEKLKAVMDAAVKSPVKPDLPLVAWQKDLNQAYIRSSWDKDALSFMTGCRTPVQNFHAHIDAGGFDMTAYGETLVTDPAIYTYKNDENRKHFKSAFWHNCLTVNHKNMWEYQGSWAYGPQKEGRLISVTEEKNLVTAVSCHKNYEPAIAKRMISMIDNKMLLILDEVSGLKANDSVQLHFHLDRSALHLTPKGVLTEKPGHPNVELAYHTASMDTGFEIGKISTQNDVWHDSTIVHLNHTMEKDGTFFHATLILPHKQDETTPLCQELLTKQEENQIHISFCLKDTETPYHFLWNGENLKPI